MKSLADAPRGHFSQVKFLLTDMDETLTYRGRLSAAAYAALERLQSAGIKVMPVTAAPAGWCDQMARMWPVDGVIAENGGIFLKRRPEGRGVVRVFWHEAAELSRNAERLKLIADAITRELPFAVLADDQPFRLATLAFAMPEDVTERDAIVDALCLEGVDLTMNDLWILAWFGGFDKLAMSRRILAEHFALDIDAEGDAVMYCGDSSNDAPMFEFFEHTIGVSTVRQHVHVMAASPTWVTAGPGGAGFVEAVEALLTRKSP